MARRLITAERSFAGLFGALALALGLSLVPGCGPADKDVTNDPRFGDFSTAIVGEWRTKVPLILVRGEFYGGFGYGLLLEINSDRLQKVADLPVGTKIRIERLMLDKNISRTLLCVSGSVTEGEYAGHRVYVDGRMFPFDVWSFYAIHYDNKLKETRPSWTVLPEFLEK